MQNPSLKSNLSRHRRLSYPAFPRWLILAAHLRQFTLAIVPTRRIIAQGPCIPIFAST
jgi:hypothetical protein